MEFKDAHFMKAEEKYKVYNDFKKLLNELKNNYKDKDLKCFSKRLYEHLHLHCGFIAHYCHGQFFSTYFEDPEDTKLFMNNFLNYSYCNQEYEDINNAMSDLIKNFKRTIDLKMNSLEIEQDKGKIRRLMLKHDLASISIDDVKSKDTTQIALTNF